MSTDESVATETWLQSMWDAIVKVDPRDVIKDAQAAGLEVTSVPDFREEAMNYWRIDDIADEYAARTARWCAASGASSGFGGVATTITIGGVDIAHMAARLYWLCQRLCVLNGFEPENPMQLERTQEIYLIALGFDTAAQAAIKQQMVAAAKIAGKKGAKSNLVLKFIVYVVATLTGKNITTKVAAQFIPVIGGIAGASMNYFFAKSAATKMKQAFRDDYFRTWQVSQKKKR